MERSQELMCQIIQEKKSIFSNVFIIVIAVTASSTVSSYTVASLEEDYQVTMEDFTNWKDKFGEKENWTFHSYPGLTHIFMQGERKNAGAEYYIKYLLPLNPSYQIFPIPHMFFSFLLFVLHLDFLLSRIKIHIVLS